MGTRMLIKAKRGRITALLHWSRMQGQSKVEKTRPNIFCADTIEVAPSNVVMFRHTPPRQEEELRRAS